MNDVFKRNSLASAAEHVLRSWWTERVFKCWCSDEDSGLKLERHLCSLSLLFNFPWRDYALLRWDRSAEGGTLAVSLHPPRRIGRWFLWRNFWHTEITCDVFSPFLPSHEQDWVLFNFPKYQRKIKNPSKLLCPAMCKWLIWRDIIYASHSAKM